MDFIKHTHGQLFSELEDGDVFNWSGQEYAKIKEITYEDHGKIIIGNAIRINDKTLVRFNRSNIVNDATDYIPFTTLFIGDIFIHEEEIMMKINPICSRSDTVFNAVILGSAKLYTIPENTQIIKPKYQFNVEV